MSKKKAKKTKKTSSQQKAKKKLNEDSDPVLVTAQLNHQAMFFAVMECPKCKTVNRSEILAPEITAKLLQGEELSGLSCGACGQPFITKKNG